MEDLKDKYPELEDHLNLISIENVESASNAMEGEDDALTKEIVRLIAPSHDCSTTRSATCTI